MKDIKRFNSSIRWIISWKALFVFIIDCSFYLIVYLIIRTFYTFFINKSYQLPPITNNYLSDIESFMNVYKLYNNYYISLTLGLIALFFVITFIFSLFKGSVWTITIKKSFKDLYNFLTLRSMLKLYLWSIIWIISWLLIIILSVLIVKPNFVFYVLLVLLFLYMYFFTPYFVSIIKKGSLKAFGKYAKEILIPFIIGLLIYYLFFAKMLFKGVFLIAPQQSESLSFILTLIFLLWFRRYLYESVK